MITIKNVINSWTFVLLYTALVWGFIGPALVSAPNDFAVFAGVVTVLSSVLLLAGKVRHSLRKKSA